MLVDGTWRGAWRPSDDDDDAGRFVRKPSAFRGTPDPWEAGRYHLYVAGTCPWAHRVRIVAALKGLADHIPVHFVEPALSDQGWRFAPGADPLHGAAHLWELYVRADPHYTGRATVPLLWDTVRDTAVNNESSELVRILDALPSSAPRLSPPERRAEIDPLAERMYAALNDGVYRTGFATSQAAYDEAVAGVFAMMDELEARLARGPWLLGDALSELDVRLFVTLVRFELAYYVLFRCCVRHLGAYPRLLDHTRRFLQLPGVAATVDADAIRRGYFSIRRLNPSGLLPRGPRARWADAPSEHPRTAGRAPEGGPLSALLLLLATAAHAETWQLDPAHSRVGFSVSHMMISTVEGQFSGVTGTLDYTPGHLADLDLSVQVDMSTVDTRNADRDAHLRKPDFLDVEKYPTMSFVATKVKPHKDGTFEVVGDLTIKGVTKPVTLQGKGLQAAVTDPWGGKRVGATATGTIDRQAFGVTYNQALDAGGVLVGDEVTLNLAAEFVARSSPDVLDGGMRTAWRWLHAAFHRPSSPAYRRVEAAVAVLIVLSVGLFVAELALDVRPAWLERLDQAVLVVFAVEVGLRLLSFRPPALAFYEHGPLDALRAHVVGRIRYALRPLILVDLLTVATALPALRSLRALRLLRLLRSRRLFRYADPFHGIARSFEENGLLFGFGLAVFATSVAIGGASFYLSERTANDDISTLPDGMWWAIVTLTTVGYGDLTPVTGVGRAVAAALMITGMFTLALFAGIVGSTLIGTVLTMREEHFRMSEYIDHLVVCGYEPGARMLLDVIAEEIDLDQRDVVIFAPGDRPQDLPDTYLWLRGDPTKESELDKVRLVHAGAVILVGSRVELPQQADARTILTAFTMRRYLKRNPLTARRKQPLYVVAEILDAENVEHARTAGADEVIETTRMGFSVLAHAVQVPGTATLVGELADVGGNSLFVGAPPLDAGPTFADVARALKQRHGVLAVGLREAGADVLNPADDAPVGPSTGVVYIARTPVLGAHRG
ncbi:MAG: YceI family protein [Myxococcota bacterium]